MAPAANTEIPAYMDMGLIRAPTIKPEPNIAANALLFIYHPRSLRACLFRVIDYIKFTVYYIYQH